MVVVAAEGARLSTIVVIVDYPFFFTFSFSKGKIFFSSSLVYFSGLSTSCLDVGRVLDFLV